MTVEERLAALEQAWAAMQAQTPTSYYTSRYGGEEIDNGIDRAKVGGAIDAAMFNKVSVTGGTMTGGLEFSGDGNNGTIIPGNESLFIRSTDIATGGFLDFHIRNPNGQTTENLLWAYRSDTDQSFGIATATPPQEYDLPLAAGVSGAIKYRKNQFGEVSVSIRIQPNMPINGGSIVGTMPVGYRPVYGRSTVAYAISGGVGYIGTIDFNADGTIKYFLQPISGANDVAIANAQFVSTYSPNALQAQVRMPTARMALASPH